MKVSLKPKKINLKQELTNVKEKYGSLSAHTVLAEAKKKSSPLHKFFEWDDSIASHKWRLHEARMLITTAKVYVNEQVSPDTVRAFVSLKTDDGRRFVDTSEAMTNEDLALELFDGLNNRMSNIRDQLISFGVYQGTIKDSLEQAMKPIAKQKAKLEKTNRDSNLTPKLA